MVRDLLIGMLIMVIIVAVLAGVLYGIQTVRNKASEEVWNNGVCSVCDQRFIPYAISNGVKCYVCYGCGAEVTRYY